MKNFKGERLEFEINGTKIPYDTCSKLPIGAAKSFYRRGYNYIGSSHIIYVNGLRNEFKELYHFFKKI